MKLVELIPGTEDAAGSAGVAGRNLRLAVGQGRGGREGHAEFYREPRRDIFDVECVLRKMQELEMTIEEVDACTGPAIGRPKSATFRTVDIVGLDVLVHVMRNIYENVPRPMSRARFIGCPRSSRKSLKRRMAGRQDRAADFTRSEEGGGRQRNSYAGPGRRWNTARVRRRNSVRLKRGKGIEDTRERVRMLVTPAIEGKGRRQSEPLAVALRVERDVPLCGAARAGDRRPNCGCRPRDALGIWRGSWARLKLLGRDREWRAWGRRLSAKGMGLPPVVGRCSGRRGKTFYESEKGTDCAISIRLADALKPVEEPARDHYF